VWLTQALVEGGKLPGCEVTSVEVVPMDAGVGFMGEVARLSLTYAGAPADAPRTMIVKLPTQDAAIRAMLAPAAVFEREARFYGEIADDPAIASPNCWYAGMDVEADDSCCSSRTWPSSGSVTSSPAAVPQRRGRR
jgi:hypothetical protein